uniref:Uncharacterized protein n=2 Tax=Oryza punctata TaxID=4537 RepID=A0A0E0MLL8_ORYPU
MVCCQELGVGPNFSIQKATDVLYVNHQAAAVAASRMPRSSMPRASTTFPSPPHLRSAMDMDMAHYLTTELTKNATTSAAKGWYRKLLPEKILNNLTGILSFCNKLPEPESSILKELRVDAASIQAKLAKQRQYIPRASIHPQLTMGCSSDGCG